MKVLIIKTGYSETLDGNISETVSYGDILRTTAILHIFKEDQVSWLTDYKAIPLLEGNRYINKIIPINAINLLEVESEHFDIVVNLEKVPGLCALTEKISAWNRFGFRFDFMNGMTSAHEHSVKALALVGNIKMKRNSTKCWLENLYEMMGKKWNGEGYILGYKPAVDIKNDIGLNYHVGLKWPNKSWSKWDELYSRLNKEYKISYQQAIDNLHGYIDWISSCRLIISSDSLGVHIALALNKKAICLFGPTLSSEFHNAPNFIKLTPPLKYDCIPCVKPRCDKELSCMDLIEVNEVEKAARKLLALALDK